MVQSIAHSRAGSGYSLSGRTKRIAPTGRPPRSGGAQRRVSGALRRIRLNVGLGLSFLLVASGCTSSAKITEADLAPKTESTKIFAADGSLITKLKQEENREIRPLKEIPGQVRNAIVAIEDARFYTHRGIDAKAILRAVVANAQSGSVVEGGSTITQQLVRNALADVGKAQTIQRKIKEAVYAQNVDKAYSKDKILELYLNTVYFGAGAYGVATAAETYFDKEVEELALPEAALIAGLIRSPLAYDPWANPGEALKRRNRVLSRMVAAKFLTRKEAEAAKKTPLGVVAKPTEERYESAYFVDLVTRTIQRSKQFAALGSTEQERGNALFRGGLRVHTTLDERMQKAAEAAVAKVLNDPDDPSATLVSIDPKSGHIKALVGGRDFFAAPPDDPCIRIGAINADGSPKFCGKVNLALGQAGGGSGRQSGSSFKPFVLAAALQNGIKESDVYNASACVDIPQADAGGTKPWHVCNYEESGGGSVTVREGTYRSINSVYAQVIYDIGRRVAGRSDLPAEAGAREVVALAEKMGLCLATRPLLPAGQTCKLAAVPSAALGANAVSTLDMTSAFTPFANLGMRPEPVAVTKITDAKGKVLWQDPQKKQQVIPPSIAYLTNNVLQDVITKGTGARNGKIGRPAFGKTGTSQEWRDAWFVGGAGTDLVTGVSVFWPDGEIEMKASCRGRRTTYEIRQTAAGPVAQPPECRPTRIRVFGGSWPTQIWAEYMKAALAGTPPSDFPVPDLEMISVKVDAAQGCLPGPVTPPGMIVTRKFLKGTEPTRVCTEARPLPQPDLEIDDGVSESREESPHGDRSGPQSRHIPPEIQELLRNTRPARSADIDDCNSRRCRILREIQEEDEAEQEEDEDE